jgi:hypothetical protein
MAMRMSYGKAASDTGRQREPAALEVVAVPSRSENQTVYF